MMTVKEKISALLEELNKGIYEKEEVMALALLSSIAGESIFLLGPPGVAKSLIARRLKYAYKDGSAFEYLMSRFSTPDEIFGPVSISKLKNEDKYERIVENYLPSATVVFLDEIWKAGPSIQNALLTALNEKKFRNGENEISLPMKGLISASNELPAKGEGLEALWDRFVVRLVVEGIEDEAAFDKMIAEDLHSFDDPVADENKITNDEYGKWDSAIKNITIPENVFNVIHVIRRKIAEHNQKEGNTDAQIYISDRRWRKIVRLLRASAFLNDRNEVDLMDCSLIQHCLWNEEAERDMAYQFVRDAIGEYGYTVDLDFEGVGDELDQLKAEIDGETGVDFLEVVYGEYYKTNAPPDKRLLLIKQSDFASLNKNNQSAYLYYWDSNSSQLKQLRFTLRKGTSEFNIFIDDKEFDLVTSRKNIRKPNQKLVAIWDEQIGKLFWQTELWNTQIEKYRKKDLKHIRDNIFGSDSFVYAIESHITATIKEIEKFEVDIRAIQNGYKKLKDEEVIVK